MTPILQTVRIASISLLTLTVALTPTLSFAASTKTYTFTNLSPYTTTGTTTWYSPQWKFRQKITITKDAIGEDLTDFPVVVRFDDESLSGARDDRHDILFTTSDGVTKLSHELEDNSTAWVKVPKLTPLQDTELYLYYGNPTAEDQQNVSDVWTNGYIGVWQMGDDPAGDHGDSTGNGFNATSRGGMEREDSSREGKTGRATSFDGTNDALQTPIRFDGAEVITINYWSKWNAYANDDDLLAELSDNTNTHDNAFFIDPNGSSTGTYGVAIQSSTGSFTYRIEEFPRPSAGEWHQYSLILDNSTTQGDITAFVDAQKQSTTITYNTKNQKGAFRDDTLYFMSRAATSLHGAGSLDHFSISRGARSGSWIRAEYMNQSNTEDFLTISDTVETTTSEATITLKPIHALSFTNLLSFKPNTQATTTFQLSNDAGKTWLFYTQDGWKPANPSNPSHRSSINDISSHIKTFPQGAGKLTWKAYLQPGSTLDSLAISYTPSTSTTTTATFSQTIIALNSLYRQAYNQDPSFLQWTYWAKRMLVEKKTQQAWLDAMKWARVNGR